jgi:hypothetical protein
MSPNKAASRRYVVRLMSIMTVYLVSLFIGVGLRNADALTPATAVVAALVPGLCIVMVFWALGRLLVELQDEFLRMLMVRQVLIAAAFAFSIAAVHGFLTSFDIVSKVDAYWAPVLFFFGLFVGQVANRVKYGTWGQCA